MHESEGSGAGSADAIPPQSAAANARAESFLRSRRYVVLLILAAVLGVPITAAAYGFLRLTTSIQGWVYTNLPHGLGFSAQPVWWPILPMVVAGLVVGATVRYLPGTGGHVPVDGLHVGGVAPGAQLPGIAIAALASISLGAVVGPEAPLIALGGGVAVWIVRLVKRDLPLQAAAIMAAMGSFAAVSTLLGSPLTGAFLIIEASGLAGAIGSVVLVPGLLGAGIGALVFTGLDALTGQGTFSLAIPNLPHVGRPTVAEFGWAIVIGLLAAAACWLLRRGATAIRGVVERWTVLVTGAIGLAIAGLAIAYVEATDHPNADVLFSGQAQLPVLMEHAAGYSVGALLLLVACKGLAYAGSLVGFRGGPTFPGMFIGAVGGIAMSHLPGLSVVPAAAMGIGAMTAGMLRLPFTAVLLTTLFLGSDGVSVMPIVIVAVVVAHVATIRLTPKPSADTASTEPPDPHPHQTPA
ncbi:MAG TPA: chloride channel protein [Micromonosporaceae bacterium]|nr:chloride channel protein [Micromonosporaceae bacterium]